VQNFESTAGRTTEHQAPQHGLVNIWKVPLLLPVGVITSFEKILSLEEIIKSRQFLFKKERDRFIISRGALRTILSSYLNEHPGKFVFGYGTHGKPFLTHPPTACNLKFNLSHSIDMAIIAVSPSTNLGIDLEKVRTLPQLKQIVERFFSQEECLFFESANSEVRERTFFQIWTRREAAAKALGLDLSAALSDIGIPFFSPGNGIRFEYLQNTARNIQSGMNSWFIQDLQIDASHVGAICLEGESCEVAYHDLIESSGGLISELSQFSG
jgi:4'-phosphopantetheinyl transferase